MTASPPPKPVVPTCRKERKMPPSVAVLDRRFKRLCPYRTLRRNRWVLLSVCSTTVFASSLTQARGRSLLSERGDVEGRDAEDERVGVSTLTVGEDGDAQAVVGEA